MIIVFNSSPLIFLSKLNIIKQAFDLFSEVIIPVYVREEILRKEDITSDKLETLVSLANVNVVKAKNFYMVNALCGKLGRGESEAIVVAIEQSADFVILDDHVARVQACRIGLNVKGTLGIIKRLMELAVIQYDMENLYQDLSAMKFRVKRSILDEIFRGMG